MAGINAIENNISKGVFDGTMESIQNNMSKRELDDGY